jgi:L-threonylcarbamoyladenylate synthase
VPYETTAGLEKVAVRMPNHKVALKLIDMSETPIVAPSANIAGKPSPTNAKHVLEDLDGKIEAIIDSGETTTGLESTVVDTTVYPVEILRPGPITPEMLEKVVKIEFSEIPSARYTHYAPKAELIVVSGDKAKVVEKISELISELNRNGLKVGLAVSSKERYKADLIIEMGELEAFARNLFPALREFDRQGVDVIVIEGVEERGIGVAVMNRLKKAASKFYRV